MNVFAATVLKFAFLFVAVNCASIRVESPGIDDRTSPRLDKKPSIQSCYCQADEEIGPIAQAKRDIGKVRAIIDAMVYLLDNGQEDEVLDRYFSPTEKEWMQKRDPEWRTKLIDLMKRENGKMAKELKNLKEREPYIVEPINKRASAFMSFLAEDKSAVAAFEKIDGVWYWK